MHLTQPRPTNCIFSPQLDEFYHNMLWRLNEVHTQILSCYQQEFYLTTIEHHGRREKEQPNMEMLKIKLL